MSAANCPETPRQKMIGMMYLFLTAMLAINVSKSILDAFVVVNESLEATNATFESKNDIMYTQLEAARANDPKAVPFYEASLKVKKLAKEMRAFITDLRVGVINEAEPKWGLEKGDEYVKTMPLHDIEAKDDYDTPTRYFVGKNDVVADGHARKLKEALAKYRKDLLDILKDDKLVFNDKPNLIKKLGDLGINTSDPEHVDPDHPEENNWETSHFYHLPLAAAVTMLSQIENQVQNAEATVVSKLLGGIGSLDFKFDTLAAKVIPKSSYIIQGGQYEADLFVAAFSSSAKPEVWIGEKVEKDKDGKWSITGANPFNENGKPDTISVVNGMGKLVIPANSIGPKKYAALIKVKNSSTGETKSYPLMLDSNYFAQYTVAAPSACVSPTKMNMLYIGVENPIDISVSGFPADRISASISGGRIYRKGKQWVVKVTKAGKATINVSVKGDDGKMKPMGRFPFRVSRIPAPMAKINNSTGGIIKKSILKVQPGIKADLENFAFDLRFNVTSFKVVATIDGYDKIEPARGARFTPKQKALIAKVRRGGRVMFTDIKAKGPDGRNRKVNDIVFKLK